MGDFSMSSFPHMHKYGSLASRRIDNEKFNGLNIEVKVESRPITQQGMMSIQSNVQGRGRLIMDKSYYLGKLRSKKQELKCEIDKLNEEMESFRKQSQTNVQLRKKQEALLDDVENLKGELRDYTMAMEKVMSGLELDEIKEQVESLQEIIEIKKKNVDKIFMERIIKDKATQEAVDRLHALELEIEKKLNEELDSDQNLHKRVLHTEYKMLKAEVDRLDTEIEEVERSSSNLEQRLSKSSPAHQRAVMLVEQILKAEAKLKIIKTDNSVKQLSPGEEREALLFKIHQDSTNISKAEERTQELELDIKDIEEKLAEAEKTLCDLKTAHGGRAEKFLEMQQKEKLMQSFIDNYPIKRSEQEQLLLAVKQKIELLHQHDQAVQDVSKKLENTNQSVSQTEAPDLAELQEVLELRRGELKELKASEEKTELDLSTTQHKIFAMQEEIERFCRVDELRLQSEKKCSMLEIEKKMIEEKRMFLVEQIKDETTKMEAIQGILGESLLHSKLEDLNQKLISAQKSNTELQKEIEMKERELNYNPLLENVRFMVSQLNYEIKNNLSHCP